MNCEPVELIEVYKSLRPNATENESNILVKMAVNYNNKYGDRIKDAKEPFKYLDKEYKIESKLYKDLVSYYGNKRMANEVLAIHVYSGSKQANAFLSSIGYDFENKTGEPTFNQISSLLKIKTDTFNPEFIKALNEDSVYSVKGLSANQIIELVNSYVQGFKLDKDVSPIQQLDSFTEDLKTILERYKATRDKIASLIGDDTKDQKLVNSELDRFNYLVNVFEAATNESNLEKVRTLVERRLINDKTIKINLKNKKIELAADERLKAMWNDTASFSIDWKTTANAALKKVLSNIDKLNDLSIKERNEFGLVKKLDKEFVMQYMINSVSNPNASAEEMLEEIKTKGTIGSNIVEELNKQKDIEGLKNNLKAVLTTQDVNLITILHNTGRKESQEGANDGIKKTAYPFLTNRNALENRINNEWRLNQKMLSEGIYSSELGNMKGSLKLITDKGIDYKLLNHIKSSSLSTWEKKAKELIKNTTNRPQLIQAIVDDRTITVDRKPVIEYGLLSTLNGLGIDVTRPELESLFNNPTKYFKLAGVKGNVSIHEMFTSNKNGIIRNIFHTGFERDAGEFEELSSAFNPLSNNKLVKVLANLKAENSDKYVLSNYRNNEGNMISSNSIPSRFSLVTDKLTNEDKGFIEDMRKGDFTRYSAFLPEATKEERKKYNDKINLFSLKEVNYFYIDSMNKENGGETDKPKTRPKMTREEQYMQMITSFFNSGNDLTYMSPEVMSDKSKYPLLSFERIEVADFKDVYDKDGKLNLVKAYTKGNKDEEPMNILNMLMQSAYAEIERYNMMVDLTNKYNNNELSVEDKLRFEKISKTYKDGAMKFFFYTEMNKENTFVFTDGKIDISINDNKKAIAAIVNRSAELSINKLVDEFKKYGIYNYLESRIADEYKKKSGNITLSAEETKRGKGYMDKPIRALATEMHINQILLNHNFTMTFGGDPAMFYKEKKGSWIRNSIDTYFKRMGGISGTAIKGRYIFKNEDGTTDDYSKVEYFVIDDVETRRYQVRNKELLDVDQYGKVNVADAEEITSLREDMTVLYSKEGISTDTFKKIIDNLNAGKMPNLHELGVELQKRKPLFFATEYDQFTASNQVNYMKSSSYAATKELAAGFDLEVLQKYIEKREKKHIADGNRINVRVITKSAAKARGIEPFAIFDVPTTDSNRAQDRTARINEVKVEAMFERGGMILDRDGLGLQQEELDNEDDTITNISQLNKLAFQGLLLDDRKLFIYKGGKPISAKELKKIKENIRKEIFKEAKNEFEKEFGITNGKFTDLKKIVAFIKEELISSGKANEADMIRIAEDGNLVVPLYLTPVYNTIASNLVSLITNRVVKSRMQGKSHAQMSNLGFRHLGDYNKSNIIFTDSFNESLTYTEIEGNTVKRAQIIIPWPFKDIDMKDYMVGNKIDMNKIDKALLNTISARIPNQSHSSTIALEIVGFLPQGYEDMVILPDEITAQMGSDFDIDHLYSYLFNHEVDSNGKLTKIREKTNKLAWLQNNYMEVLESLFTHPEVAKKSLRSLDFKDVEDYVEKKLNSKEINLINNHWDIVNTLDDYNSNQSGKKGIAIQSVHSVVMAYLEDKGMKLNEAIKFNGKTYTGVGLGTYKNHKNEDRTNFNFTTMIQNEAVDNANNKLLDATGWTLELSKAFNGLNALITDEKDSISGEMIMAMFNHPIVKELQFLLEQSDSQFSGLNYTFNGAVKKLIRENKLTLEPKVYTAEEIINSYKNPVMDKGIALSILESLVQANRVGQSLVNIGSVLNIDSKGVGSDFNELESKLLKYNKVLKDKIFESTKQLFEDEDGTNELGETISLGIKYTKDLFNNKVGDKEALFHYKKPLYTDIIQLASEYKGTDLNAEDISYLSNATLDYLKADRTNPIFEGDSLDSIRSKFLFGESTLYNRVNAFLKSISRAHPAYKFISNLEGKIDRKTGAVYIEYKQDTKTEEEVQLNANSLLSMFYSDDLVENLLAKDLLKYNFAMGDRFNFNSFNQLISPFVLESIGINRFYEDINQDLDNRQVAEQAFLQMVRHKPSLIKSTGNPIRNVDGLIEVDKEYVKEIEDYKDLDNILKVGVTEPYILWKIADLETASKSTYRIMPLLGKGNKTEFVKGETLTKSVLNANEDTAVISEDFGSIVLNGKEVRLHKSITSLYQDVNKIGKKEALESLSSFKDKFISTVITKLEKYIPEDLSLSIDNTIYTKGVNINSKKIKINPNRFNTSMLNYKGVRDEFETTLQHELLHTIFNNLLSVSDSDTKIVKDEGVMKRVEVITRIYEHLLNEKLAGNAKGSTDRMLTDTYDAELNNALDSIDEFMIALMTDKNVFDKLKNITYDKVNSDKSAIEQALIKTNNLFTYLLLQEGMTKDEINKLRGIISEEGNKSSEELVNEIKTENKTSRERVNDSPKTELVIQTKADLKAKVESTKADVVINSSKTPIFNTLPSKSDKKTMTYAGIGSRETTPEVLEAMTKAAKYLEDLGYTLNTGKSYTSTEKYLGKEAYDLKKAESDRLSKLYGNKVGMDEEGADRAFSAGTSRKNLYSPNSRIPETAMQVMKEIHPKPSSLSDGAAKLMARNTNQVFGENLDTPVDFVLFYAEETNNSLRPKGGTGQAVEMARRKGIPTINMFNDNWREQLKELLSKEKLKEVETEKREVNRDGINISSYESDLGSKLSNFARLPINYKGVRYSSSEEAYQENKPKEKLTETEFNAKVKELMTDVLRTKLLQYPDLTTGIDRMGGIEFLNNSTHNLIKDGVLIKQDKWTGKDGLFMQSLRDAYSSIKNIAKPAIQQSLFDTEQNQTQEVNKTEKPVSLFNKEDKELKKGSVVEYNGKRYLFWNNNNGKAQIINTDGTKFSGTPNIDKLTVLGSYQTTMYNNTEYIVTDKGNVYSGANGGLVYTAQDNSTKVQKERIINQAKLDKEKSMQTTAVEPEVKQEEKEIYIPEKLKPNTFTFSDDVVIDTPFKLNTQQEEALGKMESFISSKGKKFVLKGYAGTGKTSIINILSKYIYEKSGKTVVYSSPTHRANAVLSSNIDKGTVMTLHKAFGLSPMMDLETFSTKDLKFETKGSKLGYGSILVIDESSMINDELFKFIEGYVEENGITVLFMGDPAQLKPPKQTTLSKAFSVEDSYELTKVERTGISPLLFEATDIRNSKETEDQFSYMSKENSKGEGVTFTNSEAAFFEKAKELFTSEEAKENKLYVRVVAGTNEKIEDINNKIREAIYGNLAVNEYNKGELLMGYANYKTDYRTGKSEIVNSIDYEVSEVSELKETEHAGKKVTYYTLKLENILNKKEAPKYINVLSKRNDESVYTAIAEEFEKLRLAAIREPNKRAQAGKWQALSEFKDTFALPKSADMGVDSKGSKAVKISKTIDYGYAHTIHKSQGGTYNNIMIDSRDLDKFKDSELRKQLRYVAVTRARKYAYVLASNKNIKSTDKYKDITLSAKNAAADVSKDKGDGC